MATIKLVTKGDYSHFRGWLHHARNASQDIQTQLYGEKGKELLAEATPKRTGKTSQSWEFSVTKSNGKISITFKNTNKNRGENIALLIQYGHGKRGGGYIAGRDYINPAMEQLQKYAGEDAWNKIISAGGKAGRSTF